MIRFLCLVAAYLALASGFVAAVVDGTRSIAGGALSVTTVDDVLKTHLAAIQQAVSHLHPLIWDPVTLGLLRLPLWLAMGAVGLALLWLARRRSHTPAYASQY